MHPLSPVQVLIRVCVQVEYVEAECNLQNEGPVQAGKEVELSQVNLASKTGAASNIKLVREYAKEVL